MKFYIVQDDQGVTIGCETSLKVARTLAKIADRQPCTIERVTCAVNTETVRRLLGQCGGYATESETVRT